MMNMIRNPIKQMIERQTRTRVDFAGFFSFINVNSRSLTLLCAPNDERIINVDFSLWATGHRTFCEYSVSQINKPVVQSKTC